MKYEIIWFPWTQDKYVFPEYSLLKLENYAEITFQDISSIYPVFNHTVFTFDIYLWSYLYINIHIIDQPIRIIYNTHIIHIYTYIMKYCSYRNFIYSMCVSLKSCGWFSTQRVPLEAKTLAAAAKRAAQAAEQLAEAAAKEVTEAIKSGKLDGFVWRICDFWKWLFCSDLVVWGICE